ncbi:mitochondrial fission ELM1 family protein [Pelagibacteraceae bacterium]|nr:mitochondrial fission ELM1 family protein [Pelagibacteraceae bacterium]
MKNINAWLLTEGAHGMVSQVEGLAKALNVNFTHKKVVTNSFWSLVPPSITPASKNTFNFSSIVEDLLTKKNPTVLISCGRKSVIPSIVLKNYLYKKNKTKIFNIHIQNPKVHIDNFNFIVAPEHDQLQGENVIQSKGAIHYITDEEIQGAKALTEDKNILTIILGGPTKHYHFSLEELKDLFNKVELLFLNKVQEIKIVSSRRTPQSIIHFLQDKYKDNPTIIVDSSLSRKNYVQALAQAKKIIVTSDSISMLSEAATTGVPIYLAKLKSYKNDHRFFNFLESFKKLNIIKDLETKEENWTYDKLYETKRIAELLKNKIILS